LTHRNEPGGVPALTMRMSVALQPAEPVAGVPDKVRFLSSAAAYGHAGAIERRETHMSWIFLTPQLAYKLKKPVRYPYLDFSTLAAREHFCREELRLNRRLAPDVYLDIVPLLQRDDGLQLGGKAVGRIVDWLVRMRRLPADRMLDATIRNGTIGAEQIDALADVLAGFYRSVPRATLEPSAYAERFDREQATNRAVLLRPEFDALRPAALRALDALDEALEGQRAAVARRARERRIVEGHGDLRPEHVCLIEPPVIIDCLEFNRALREVDPFDELCFLGLECAAAGAAWIGPHLVERCSRLLADAPQPRLLAFYTAYRSLLRARLSAAHLLEPAPREPDRWLPQAERYLGFADRALMGLPVA
jgi:aminoglycoside phosphotransferase family enzyme